MKLNGLIVLDKISGITSRDAVNRIQGELPRKTKLGHTGTLDPLATGVLVLCVGIATRLAEYIQDLPKTYLSRFRLGVVSDTDDAAGIITETDQPIVPTLEEIQEHLKGFVGEIEQTPPSYSAARIEGQRAYDRARRGQEVLLESRIVRVDHIEIGGYDFPYLDLKIHCGKGTYIRSIARDLGENLGIGALVQTLHRSRIGHFTTEMAISEDTGRKLLIGSILPVARAVEHLPGLRVDEAILIEFQHGQFVPLPAGVSYSAGVEIAIHDQEGELFAIAQVDHQGMLRPTKVLR